MSNDITSSTRRSSRDALTLFNAQFVSIPSSSLYFAKLPTSIRENITKYATIDFVEIPI